MWLSAAAQHAALVAGLRGDEAGELLWQERAAEAARFANVFHDRHGPLATFVALRIAVHRRTVDDVLVARAFDTPPAARFRVPAMALAAAAAVAAGLPDAGERVAHATVAAAGHPWALACLARAAARRDPALAAPPSRCGTASTPGPNGPSRWRWCRAGLPRPTRSWPRCSPSPSRR